MTIIFGILILILTFFFMEYVAYFTHKYLMHGFLWVLHKDHHQVNHSKFFEKNDFFFLIFAIPSWLCIMLGMMYHNEISVWIGFGIVLYGLVYLLIYIHRRFKWIKELRPSIFKALRKAHKVHHKNLGKTDGECFGMLIVPKKYYKEARDFKNAKILKN